MKPRPHVGATVTGLRAAPADGDDAPPSAPSDNGAAGDAASNADGGHSLAESAWHLLGLAPLGPLATERKAREWALVLQSMGVWHQLRGTHAGWYVFVRADDEAPARRAIDRYELENENWPPPRTRERARHVGMPLSPIVFAALAFFFLVTGPVAGGARWFSHGAAVAELVVRTQPWRAVTALTLHADQLHVLGNVISGAIFGTGVDRRLGRGGSALAILASGAAGNAANALWHARTGSGGHATIGASTAVFGAVGILAATQVLVDRSSERGTPRRWTDAIAPIVGGAALLGALGASPEADLGAHAFGFLAGLLIGFVAALALRIRGARMGDGSAPRWWTQTSLGAIALGTVVGSWLLAMR